MTEIQVSITSCLDATKQAFHDGSAILDKIKKKRALKRAPPPPRLLEESIDQAPDEIEKEKQRGLARFGKAFQEGDHIAIIQLQQVTIQLQASLLEKLRNAAFDDDHAITDFTYLVDAADGGRDKTIAVLHEFKQRLLNGTSREDFHSPSPNSSKSNLTVQSPVQTPPVQTPPVEIAPKTRTERTLSQPLQHKTLPKPAETGNLKKHPTWSRDFSASGSEDGDAVPGADEVVEHRHKKRNSLLHFLKHTRTNSSTDKHSLSGAIAEEIPRSNGNATPAGQLPFRPPTDDNTAPTSNPAGGNNRDRAATTSSNSGSTAREPRFTYEEWEDNPSEIWGARPSHLDRRETVAIAPHAQKDDDHPNALNRQVSHTSSGQPPSPVLTNRTNSMAPSFASFGGAMAAGFGAPLYPSATQSSVAIVQPTPDNDYLGFCKAAWKLQNGDKKNSFAAHKQVEPWSRHPGAYAAAASYLACSHGKCAFRSNFTHHDVDVIWNKCFTIEAKGVKFRWKFLAKSHVMQKVVVKGNYSFKCLFCALQGLQGGGGVYHGIDYYLDHVNEAHRGTRMNEVVLYKTGCIIDRVAEDTEDFDVNLWPASAGPNTSETGRKGTEWLNDDLMMGDPYREGRDDSMFSANEPWNEGLSDFHYRGEFDRTELE
ncbi:hypothetical protein CKM354_000174600 [Cercospora kikuchii]|uniref:Uncharacterized protein n=1 Tax=Cercospora kikuchii TaxID=84275 RepID=A0A9P3F8K5_9PEZI|nr:uncharacterized protein CKM354_000174600 [Cercospora kikuchii]GIZ38326.1 hypothetical protein CKM354_000174600 [Cercospora kikuchii]